MSKVLIKVNTDTMLYKTLSVYMLENSLNMFLKQSLNSVFIDNYLSIILGILFVLFFIKYTYELKCIGIFKSLVKFEFLFFILLFYSIVSNSDYSNKIFTRCIWVIGFCIPLSVVAYGVNDWNYIIEKMSRTTIVCSLISIVNIFSYSGDTYNMALGYSMLPLILFQMKLSKTNKRFLFFVLLQVVLIVLFCSRGPLLCIFVYAFYLFFATMRKSRIALFLGFIILVAIVVVLLNYGYFLDLAQKKIGQYDIKSRTLEMVINNRIGYDSGRKDVRSYLFPHVLDKPVTGLGVAGEIRYISSSPHFLFLEFLLHYGVILGSAICLFVCYAISRSLLEYHFRNEIIIILACCGFIHLMISSTYLETPFFWILISTSLKEIRQKKNERKVS